MTRAQFDACLQNQGMIDGLKWVKERGRKLGIVGAELLRTGAAREERSAPRTFVSSSRRR